MRARPTPPARDRFSQRVLRWYDRHGRKNLPWQHPRSAYRVWLSEIMLQQTQVATVIPYFQRFVERFPDIASLAAAPLDEVLRHWAGLGYYARARNLHRAARLIVECHGGEFPQEFDAVQALPGIGRSTAGAILAQAFGQRHAILDGNVRRLLSRYHAVPGWPGEPRVAAQLWHHAESHLPSRRLADYTQALMDLGATVCGRRPDCARCPLRGDCRAHAQGQAQKYPQPRPHKVRPLRATRMLILERADGSILLERRPTRGIWGGLWCLPELPAQARAAAHCRSAYGVQVQRARILEPLRHGFTHFDLDIHPIRLRVQTAPAAAPPEEGRVWYRHVGRRQARHTVALPAPVQKLLDQLIHEESAA
ncbi:MAG TPA: A/G-specific adenine glycosylase [Nevskiales bacterium]|nr:A/G-specific adenine glycosylase [Nevskiales bacterium]